METRFEEIDKLIKAISKTPKLKNMSYEFKVLITDLTLGIITTQETILCTKIFQISL